MKDTKLKARRQPLEDAHWLGEGMDGQDSLFLELDPYLYAADRELCQIIKSHYFKLRETRSLDAAEKPKALFCPPLGAIGFQLGFLTELFTVSLLAEDEDPIRDAACHEFHAELLSTGIPPERQSAYDLLLNTGWHFRSLEQLRSALRFIERVLVFGGRAVFVFACDYSSGEALIQWEDGTSVALAKLKAGEVFLVKPPAICIEQELVPRELDREEYMSAFLKRHKRYFGKAVRGLCASRLSDEEFSVPAAEGRSVAIVCWEQFGLEAEKSS